MRIRLRTEPRTRAKRKRDNGPEGQRGYNDKEDLEQENRDNQ